MSYFTEETPPAGYHPYGDPSRMWERGVFFGLGVTLPLVCSSVAQIVNCGTTSPTRAGAAAWLLYTAVQIASKMPVSFTSPSP